MHQIGERLTRLRTQAGLDVDAAADATGIALDRLMEAESGTLALDDAEIETIARVYGVDPTEIFGGRITPFRDYAGGA